MSSEEFDREFGTMQVGACPSCGRPKPPRLMTDTLTINTSTVFSRWERIKILLGWRFELQHQVPILVDRDAPRLVPTTLKTWWWHPWRRNRPQGMVSAP